MVTIMPDGRHLRHLICVDADKDDPLTSMASDRPSDGLVGNQRDVCC
jgi:hypothetical protein